MNRFRLLAIGTAVIFALTVVAQQTTRHGDGVPTVQGHLRVLTEKLDLTGDQQTKIKPTLQELHDATLKVVQDKSMSPEERQDNVRTSREKADKKIRKILNDDQKKKLDQYLQGPHAEMHGNLSGATPTAPGKPKP